MESAQQSTESASGLKEQAANAAGSVRGRASNLKAQLADALESGAGVLRQRASSLARIIRSHRTSMTGTHPRNRAESEAGT